LPQQVLVTGIRAVFPIRGRLQDTLTAAFILVVQWPAAVLTNVKPTIMVTDIGNFFPAVFTQDILIIKNQVIPTPFTGGEKNR
jgi:hypothetical protein